MCVCLSVCVLTTFSYLHKIPVLAHHWKRMTQGGVLNYVPTESDNYPGRYCPKTGHWSKKCHEKRCFLQVFRIIVGVSVMILT